MREKSISKVNHNIMKQIEFHSFDNQSKNRNFTRLIKTPINVNRMNKNLVDNALEKLQNIKVDSNSEEIKLMNLTPKDI